MYKKFTSSLLLGLVIAFLLAIAYIVTEITVQHFAYGEVVKHVKLEHAHVDHFEGAFEEVFVPRTGNEKYGCLHCRYVYWQQVPQDKSLGCDRCFRAGRPNYYLVYLGTQPRPSEIPEAVLVTD